MLYYWEVHFLAQLQNLCQFGTDFWLIASKLGDPAAVFHIFLPFVGSLLSPVDVINFTLCGATSEFLNGVLKWIIDGPRPYWWVKESNSSPNSMPNLQQFSITCETGPGNPSGHVMVSASVWFILAHICAQRFSKNRAYTIWLAYGGFLAVVAISRLFIATHFPHQVVIGAIMGIAVGWLFNDQSGGDQVRPKRRRFATLIFALAIFAVITFASLKYFGLDPNKSIKMAVKHCADRSWIHISTTPIHSLFRDIGAIVGLGIATQSQYWGSKVHLHISPRNRLLSAIVAFLIVQFISKFPLPELNLSAHYCLTVIQSVMISLVSVWLVPQFIAKVL